MKGKDLFANIQEAREHITRLKKEAELLENSPQEAITSNIHEYVNEVLYSLNKNELEIDKKHRELKDKLPLLQPRREDPEPLPNAYKKQRRRLNSTKQKKEESTKVDDSLSFMLDNRQIKMHSFNEKHTKNDLTSDRHINSNADILLDSEANRRSTPASSQFRSRFEKRQPRAVDILTGSKIGERQRTGKMAYMSTHSKPYLHQFQLIEGTVDSDTPEFASFQRVYESIFPRVQEQLSRLESLSRAEGVANARLDGKRLAYLCLKEKISKEELLECLLDVPPRPQPLQPRSRFAGKEGRIRAVNRIIAFWRMRSIRDKYHTLRRSTITIQRFFKRQLLRLALEKRIRERN